MIEKKAWIPISQRRVNSFIIPVTNLNLASMARIFARLAALKMLALSVIRRRILPCPPGKSTHPERKILICDGYTSIA